MNSFWNYTIFSARERRGVLIILAVILVVNIVNVFIPYFIKQTEPSQPDWWAEVDLFKQQLILEKTKVIDKQSKFNKPNINKLQLNPLNPNGVTKDELLEMGIPKYIVNSWINYREKGGKFYQKSDLKKLYTMDSVLFLELEPYIVISPDVTASGQTKPKYSKKELRKVNLNLADSFELEALPLIGPSLASKIVKYRNQLGGFYKTDQLYELYGIDSQTINKLIPFFVIDSSLIKPIDLMLTDYRQLSKHPYINGYEAKAIIKYREFRKTNFSVDELLQNRVLSTNTYQKIHRYLK